MSRYFVIGDVHGKAGMLDSLLKHWKEEEQLIFLGDLIDRGENGRAVLERVKDLVEQKKAICLSGNHEYMFLVWLDNPENRYDHYRRNGGDTTINSILGRPLDAPVDGICDAKRVIEEAGDLVAFIRQMPFHVETEHLIFVHAGLDLTLDKWQDTTDYQKVWLRAPFHEAENKTGKGIVFGHTPTTYLTGESMESSKLWQTADGKIGMDGGAVYGGVLHGILFENGEIVAHYAICNDGFVASDD
ncbi:metallophosphoesterase [Streptococcus cuniculi]|uniref:Serine/threonine protein phosphatase n=1 Tax=Streptococcus cuniculi TaxID=1432788 RepID=A0A4Y9JCX0_9STRE|nr:metallophosphoesterase [Streptococcus cuniculi]MBF0777214.1 serine/threonine protein phosphatase [Streptococcus cuniculi]TFU98823.1 serine/threonine protein phosphatase [Streptococcus cuniculi]